MCKALCELREESIQLCEDDSLKTWKLEMYLGDRVKKSKRFGQEKFVVFRKGTFSTVM